MIIGGSSEWKSFDSIIFCMFMCVFLCRWEAQNFKFQLLIVGVCRIFVCCYNVKMTKNIHWICFNRIAFHKIAVEYRYECRDLFRRTLFCQFTTRINQTNFWWNCIISRLQRIIFSVFFFWGVLRRIHIWKYRNHAILDIQFTISHTIALFRCCRSI